jgi:hypothetical protein
MGWVDGVFHKGEGISRFLEEMDITRKGEEGFRGRRDGFENHLAE